MAHASQRRLVKAVSLFTLITVCLSRATCQAQSGGAAFLKIPASVEAYSLGRSRIVSSGAQAIDVNPANLGLSSSRFEVYSSYGSMLSGEQYGHLAAVFAPSIPIHYIDALGLAITSLQVGGLQGADTQGNLTGTSFSAGDMSLSLAASGNLVPDFRWGVTAKGVQSQIAGYRSGMSLAADAGVMYRINSFHEPLAVTLNLTNMGEGIKFIAQRDALPTAVNAGAAMHFGPVLTTLDIERLINQQSTQFGLGMEYSLGPASLRAGYRSSSMGGNLAAQDTHGIDQALLKGLVFGVGVRISNVTIDYGVGQEAADYGLTQRVGLLVRLGEKSDESVNRIAKEEPSIVTPEQHFARAKEFLRTSEQEQARAELKLAQLMLLDKDTRLVDYYELTGMVEWNEKNFSLAKKDFEEALRIAKETGFKTTAVGNAYSGLGFCLEKEGNIAYAIRFLRNALIVGADPNIKLQVEKALKRLGGELHN